MRYLKSPIALFIVISTILMSCSQSTQNGNVNKKTETKIIATLLDQWHNDAAEAEFSPFFSLFGSNGVYIGTDETEIWTVEEFKSFAKPYFDKGKAWSFSATSRNIYFSANGSVAWFDELLNTWMGTCRGSGVFELEKDQWKLKHYVLSLTVPNNKMDSVIQVIEGNN